MKMAVRRGRSRGISKISSVVIASQLPEMFFSAYFSALEVVSPMTTVTD